MAWWSRGRTPASPVSPVSPAATVDTGPAYGGSAPGDGPVSVAGPATGAWRRTAPLQRVTAAPMPLTASGTFSAGLAAWQDPRRLAPLGHAVDPDGPSGRVLGLVEPVTAPAPSRATTVPDLVLAAPDARTPVLQRALAGVRTAMGSTGLVAPAPSPAAEPVPAAPLDSRPPEQPPAATSDVEPQTDGDVRLPAQLRPVRVLSAVEPAAAPALTRDAGAHEALRLPAIQLVPAPGPASPTAAPGAAPADDSDRSPGAPPPARSTERDTDPPVVDVDAVTGASDRSDPPDPPDQPLLGSGVSAFVSRLVEGDAGAAGPGPAGSPVSGSSLALQRSAGAPTDGAPVAATVVRRAGLGAPLQPQGDGPLAGAGAVPAPQRLAVEAAGVPVVSRLVPTLGSPPAPGPPAPSAAQTHTPVTSPVEAVVQRSATAAGAGAPSGSSRAVQQVTAAGPGTVEPAVSSSWTGGPDRPPLRAGPLRVQRTPADETDDPQVELVPPLVVPTEAAAPQPVPPGEPAQSGPDEPVTLPTLGAPPESPAAGPPAALDVATAQPLSPLPVTVQRAVPLDAAWPSPATPSSRPARPSSRPDTATGSLLARPPRADTASGVVQRSTAPVLPPPGSPSDLAPVPAVLRLVDPAQPAPTDPARAPDLPLPAGPPVSDAPWPVGSPAVQRLPAPLVRPLLAARPPLAQVDRPGAEPTRAATAPAHGPERSLTGAYDSVVQRAFGDWTADSQAAVSAGLGQRAPDGSVVFGSAPAPTVQREEPVGAAEPPPSPVEPVPTTAAAAAPPAPSAAAPPTTEQVDELARRLIEPITARLKTQLWLDRERAGLLTDLRR